MYLDMFLKTLTASHFTKERKINAVMHIDLTD